MTIHAIDEITIGVGMIYNEEQAETNDGNAIPDRNDVEDKPVIVETEKPRRQNIPRRRIVERGD